MLLRLWYQSDSRALFRVRAENLAGWGPWSPSSDALEAQDIILPVKRGATQMIMRWFNKPEGNVLRWELSRRVRGGFGGGRHRGRFVCVASAFSFDWCWDYIDTR